MIKFYEKVEINEPAYFMKLECGIPLTDQEFGYLIASTCVFREFLDEYDICRCYLTLCGKYYAAKYDIIDGKVIPISFKRYIPFDKTF